MKWRERLYWAAFVIMVIIFFRACGEGCRIFRGKKPQQDTVKIVYDTVYIQSKKDTIYQPIPSIKYQYITKTKTDTLTEFDIKIEPVDTSAILAEYYSTYIYSDTQSIQYGSIVINDTVTKNKIKSRGLKSNLNIPVVTKTVTLTQPKRTIGYVGFSALGNSQQPIYMIGADLSLKLKSDYIFGIGAMTNKGGDIMYQGQFKIPIRLRKNR